MVPLRGDHWGIWQLHGKGHRLRDIAKETTAWPNAQAKSQKIIASSLQHDWVSLGLSDQEAI